MPPRISSSPSAAHLGFAARTFDPAPWFANPHLQTTLGSRLKGHARVRTRRERVTTPDGDFLDLDFGADPGGAFPIAVVLHGLEGSTERGYVRTTLALLERAGILGVAMNFRSCSGAPNLRPRFYHSGETTDLDFLVSLLRFRFPGRAIGAIGFSLGGNVLLRYLGERGEDGAGLQAAAAISVPFDLTEGTGRLEEGAMGRFYTEYFLRSLLRKVRAKEAMLGSILDLEKALAARTVREFDEHVTAPLHGFADAWEYYREASSAPLLPRITTPTLLLHAFDDPFLPERAVPVQAAEENPWLIGTFPRRGGHVGFVDGTGMPPRFWAEEEAVRYLAAVLREAG